MSTVRRFECNDLLRFGNINLDHLTETYHIGYYLSYLAKWPEYCRVCESPDGVLEGYLLGKAEGEARRWHGHVTAITVAPNFRRMGFASNMMKYLEEISIAKNCFFVDLYVRKSNDLAIAMYKKLGYIVYRDVIGYYSGEENAFDMRKALPRDTEKLSMIPIPEPVHPDKYDLG